MIEQQDDEEQARASRETTETLAAATVVIEDGEDRGDLYHDDVKKSSASFQPSPLTEPPSLVASSPLKTGGISRSAEPLTTSSGTMNPTSPSRPSRPESALMMTLGRDATDASHHHGPTTAATATLRKNHPTVTRRDTAAPAATASSSFCVDDSIRRRTPQAPTVGPGSSLSTLGGGGTRWWSRLTQPWNNRRDDHHHQGEDDDLWDSSTMTHQAPSEEDPGEYTAWPSPSRRLPPTSFTSRASSVVAMGYTSSPPSYPQHDDDDAARRLTKLPPPPPTSSSPSRWDHRAHLGRQVGPWRAFHGGSHRTTGIDPAASLLRHTTNTSSHRVSYYVPSPARRPHHHPDVVVDSTGRPAAPHPPLASSLDPDENAGLRPSWTTTSPALAEATTLQQECSFFYRPPSSSSPYSKGLEEEGGGGSPEAKLAWRQRPASATSLRRTARPLSPPYGAWRRPPPNGHHPAAFAYTDALFIPPPVLQKYHARYQQLNNNNNNNHIVDHPDGPPGGWYPWSRPRDHVVGAHHDDLFLSTENADGDPNDDMYDHHGRNDSTTWRQALGDTHKFAQTDPGETSSLIYQLADGRLLMRLPRDQVRLIMDPDLVPGILSVEQWRVLPSSATAGATSTTTADPPRSQHPPLRYVLTVQDDLYRKLVAEMSDALTKPYCGLSRCCHDNEKVDIRVAVTILALVLFFMFILSTMVWPTQ